MTSPEHQAITIDYIAENRLDDGGAWYASRVLADYAISLLHRDDPTSHEGFYHLGEELNETVIGISEQPDLTGPMELDVYHGQGTWLFSREHRNRLHRRTRPTMTTSDYIGLQISHSATKENLLQVALPASDRTISLLQDGYARAYTANARQRGMLTRYNQNDLVLNPRRVQVAARVLRYVVAENIPASDPSGMTPEEKQAFEDYHFPYQDMPLTGGGGKTVRMRAPRPISSAKKASNG
jgi:hypothetical protein